MSGELAAPVSRHRDTPGVALHEPVAPKSRPRVEGKFLLVDGARFTVKGVTYGTFAPNEQGFRYPDRETVQRDFARMRCAGINTVRLYLEAPDYLFDLAHAHGLKVIAGAYWEG